MPDALFRQAKAKAALQGKSMKQFVNDAVRDKVEMGGVELEQNKNDKPDWWPCYGSLKDEPEAVAELKAIFEDPDFRKIEPEDWK